ncbi:sel1 repeat family protein [Pelomyxa schiedti]|nr:sel1 repeat family protein [Pelomyxa schiedti]
MGDANSLYNRACLAKNPEVAVSLLHQAAGLGSADAMARLGWCHFSGSCGVPKDMCHAFTWHYKYAGDMFSALTTWEILADQMGDPAATCCVGWCYQFGLGAERDVRRAVGLYRRAMGRVESSAVAAMHMAICHLHGEGVYRDPAIAATLLLSRAGENVDALAYLGWCHLHGCGVPKDAAKAVDILSRAVASGGGRAMVFLAECHAVGAGVCLDDSRAEQLFAKAVDCDGGPEAFGELGLLYHLLCRQQAERNGTAAETAEQRAAIMFEKGASAGDPIAMFHLGVCLRDARGVERSLPRSVGWLEKAARIGHSGAAKVLAGFSRFLSGIPLAAASSVDRKESECEAELELREVEELTQRVPELTKQVEELESQNVVLQYQIMKRATIDIMRKEISERHKSIIDTMASLISANISNFEVEILLGAGSNAAAFQVIYPHNTVRTPMVMKVIFNWDGSINQRQTLVRKNYMTECVILSLFPRHENIIHPLGVIVAPELPAHFIEKIPPSMNVYRELSRHKTLAILMPYGGIPLSSFLSSLLEVTPGRKAQVVLEILVQGLSAIMHLESHRVIHRDIKEDNILVDPDSKRLTLIDFGEAVVANSGNDAADLEVTLQPYDSAWGNIGTMPPELRLLGAAQARAPGGHSTFSYSKCDSFSLALTFYNALLPASNKFIGSEACSSGPFSTATLLASFPVSFCNCSPAAASATLSTTNKTTMTTTTSTISGGGGTASVVTTTSSTTTTTTTATTSTPGHQQQHHHPEDQAHGNHGEVIVTVLAGMMDPNRSSRVSASDAHSMLRPYHHHSS